MAAIAVIGELNLDLIVTGAPRLPRPGEEIIVGGMELTLGSSSAIMACQAARIGDDVLFLSKVGGDNFGRRALDFLRAKGVVTDAIAVDDSLATGLTISIALGSERAMVTHLGSIQEMRLSDVDFSILQTRQHLHIRTPAGPTRARPMATSKPSGPTSTSSSPTRPRLRTCPGRPLLKTRSPGCPSAFPSWSSSSDPTAPSPAAGAK